MGNSSWNRKMNNNGSVSLTAKERASIICQYWFRTTMKDNSISMIDITKIIIEYYNIAQILRWSQRYKSKTGFQLSDDDKLTTRIEDHNGSQDSYKWISPEIEPVNKGIHCWRINVNHTKNKSGGWIVFGISPPNVNLKDYFGQKDVWGIAYNGARYPDTLGWGDKDGCKCWNLCKPKMEVDILLDLEKGMMKVGIVGKINTFNKENEYNFKDIPQTNEFGGWIPHFNLVNKYAGSRDDTVGCQLRIAEIPNEFYGEKLQNDVFGFV